MFVGMVHLLPLPGSPGWDGSMRAVLERARQDAERLRDGGVDAIIVENMGDVPYQRGRVEPETVAAMTLATARVVELGLPTGVQVLAGANVEAIAVAAAAGATFIRAEAYAYAHVADEGWLDASAADVTRKRKALGADIAIWADVKKKHSAHAVTADLSLVDAARGTAFCGAQSLIVSGRETGAPTAPQDVLDAKKAGLPVMVGSGVTPENASQLAAVADGLIVGSWLKVDGRWTNEVDPGRVAQIRDLIPKK